ncbi:MAG: uracil-DNA glycosylase [Chlorobiaceae bacterium]|nr:uracil-DNA glycosylase [Chlorobiaceae bacterium]NTV16702.1 uracil-DNA glycosylase [Chlorobiaceae bacterium]
MQGSLFDSEDNTPSEERIALSAAEELAKLQETAKECRKCRLASTRRNVVVGEGNPRADMVIIGEAPGADEDASGRPFVGRSGQLLGKILQAVHFEREEVYICNILKCRPPGNRNPLQDEIFCCMPWLLRQLEIIKPEIILILGKVAANTILENNLSMGVMRGRLIRWKEFDCFVTYHPAALLRNPNWKRACWEDVQMMRRHYEKSSRRETLHKHEIER